MLGTASVKHARQILKVATGVDEGLRYMAERARGSSVQLDAAAGSSVSSSSGVTAAANNPF